MGNMMEEEVKEKLGITDWRDLTKEKFLEYIQIAPNIDKDVHLKILEQVPNFTTFATQAVSNFVEISKQQKEVTVNLATTINEISKAINTLLQKDNLTSEDRKYAVDKLIELANIVDKIHERKTKSNEKTVDKAFIFSGVIGLIFAAIFGTKYFKKSE